MKPYLEADSILKYYGERAILSDIYLRCETGDLIALWGRNGSGKSTLLEIIFGTLKAERSFVRVNDKVLSGKAYRTGLVAFLPQCHFLPPHMTVKALVRFIGTSHIPQPFQEAYRHIEPEKLKDLSGGTLRMLEILYVATRPAPFLLLDEPFTGLSPLMTETACHYLQDLTTEKGLIIADHNHRALLSVATRHLLLDDGYLRPLDSTEQLKGRYLPENNITEKTEPQSTDGGTTHNAAR